MKKILSLILLATMILSAVGCGNNTPAESNQPTPTVAVSDSKNDASEEKNGNQQVTENGEPEENDLPFWVFTQEFATPQKSFEGTLFHPSVELPLDLTTIDEIASPYKVYYAIDSGVRYEHLYTDKIADVLFSDIPVSKNADNTQIAKHIETQRDDGSIEVSCYDDDYCGMNDIYIYNYEEEPLTVKECYEKGWWTVNQSIGDFSKFFQIKNGNRQEVETLNSIFDKFGTPKYIVSMESELNTISEWKEKIEAKMADKNIAVLQYQLCYVFEDFTVSIYVNESYCSTNGFYSVEISNAEYFNSTMWAHKKEGLYNSSHVSILDME